ncbi:fluoride efflux transporter FluC [Leucobacter ruminantium]|uniref:Fluoride-specific ion channel FluC n=1 Tax=Leucobacter ruminantium TaxID=1289170 RepID=A0A939LWB7_9MICO|nr:CrcB family protein [Leucobacter ruminantium]MBO1805632.1 CrcB family protein [Leucobacter ruminantium]
MSAARRASRVRAARLADAGLVALGGACGTLARYLLDAAIGDRWGIPLGILAINVAGAYLLGLLAEGLAPGGSDRWRATRLLLGTGVLGGFTTYSALAVGSAELLLGGTSGSPVDPGLAVGYGLATIALGGLASWLGILTAQALRRGRPARATRGSAA